MEIEQVLHIFGLKEKKADVYLACLELGLSTVLPIARKANLPRTTAYSILEDLQIKGFVTFNEISGRRYFQAADPRRFKQIITRQQKIVDESLPELLALYKPSKEKPVARFYEGKSGIEQIYKELLQAHEIFAYGSFEKITDYYPNFLAYLKKQIKRGIKIKDLATRTVDSEQYQKLYHPPKQELRFLNENINLETDNIIYGDKVALISFGETIHGLVIESKAISATQRLVFQTLWEASNKVK